MLFRNFCILASALAEANFVRAGTLTLRSFLGFFGLDRPAVVEYFNAHSLDPDTPLTSSTTIESLFENSYFQNLVAQIRTQQKFYLQQYLTDAQMLDNPECAFVDIGWRGSILSAIQLLRESKSSTQLRAYYLGHWGDHLPLPETGANIKGMLADYRRGKNLREGAAYHLSLPLEAICRAAHGSVMHYEVGATGSINCVLNTEPALLAHESANALWRAPIRQGILDAVEEAARTSVFSENISSEHIRKKAQNQLLRLAFLPRSDEIDAVSGLLHSEGHNAAWHTPLVATNRPSPIFSPRIWLAGLTSPWRSGYIAATGGYPLATFHFMLEAFLLAAPPATRENLKNFALRLRRM